MVNDAGPVAPTQRSVAPDAARGLALLGIALANGVFHLSSGPSGPGLRPLDGSGLDHAVDALISLLVDRRTLPAFALMLGYGAVMILRRQEAAGASWPTARGVLVRRWLWLGAFGLAHIVLLFAGDILLQYALTSLVLILFLRRSGRTLLVWAGFLLISDLVVYGGFAALGEAGGGGRDELTFLDESTLLGGLLLRLILLVGSTVLTAPLVVATILPAVLLGVWAARLRLLERPQDHMALLRRTAVVGMTVSLVGAAPFALVVGGLWEPSAPVLGLAAGVHAATGVLGGAAFVALVALVVVATTGPARTLGGRAVRVLLSGSQAVGARSLTCYLAQSVLFVLPLAPWAGGLGVGMSTSVVALWAVGTWLVTVALAVVLRSAGRSGPAEVLLRRLAYGRRPARIAPEPQPVPL